MNTRLVMTPGIDKDTRVPRGIDRGIATVMPSTGLMPAAVMPDAFGPQQMWQAQYAVKIMFVILFIF